MLRLICSILAIVCINSDKTNNNKQGNMYRKHDTDAGVERPIHYNVTTAINGAYRVDVEVYM